MRKFFLMDLKLTQQVWLGKFIADKMHKIISKFKEEKETLRLMLNNKHRSHSANSSQTRKNSRNSSTPFRCLFVWFSLETFLLRCKLSERQTEVGSEWKQINFEHFLLVFLHMCRFFMKSIEAPSHNVREFYTCQTNSNICSRIIFAFLLCLLHVSTLTFLVYWYRSCSDQCLWTVCLAHNELIRIVILLFTNSWVNSRSLGR